MFALVRLAAEESDCTVLDNAFDVEMQLVLFAFAFTFLIWKWRVEEYRREPVTFFLDTSKQGIGFLICHFFNLYFAWAFRAPHMSQCVWYAVNIVFDTTARVYIAYLLLKYLKRRYPFWEATHFGVYCVEDGQEEVLRRWVQQASLWIGIVSVSRILMALCIWMMKTPLGGLFALVMDPLESFSRVHGHAVELVIVMVVVPFLLNVLQLQVQDNFLKYRETSLFYPMTSGTYDHDDEVSYGTPFETPRDCDAVDGLFGSGEHRTRSGGVALTKGAAYPHALEGELHKLFDDRPDTHNYSTMDPSHVSIVTLRQETTTMSVTVESGGATSSSSHTQSRKNRDYNTV